MDDFMSDKLSEEYLSVAAVGDVYMGSLPEGALDKVAPILCEHDLRFCNLEGPVSDRGTPEAKRWPLRSDTRAMSDLKKAGFDVVSFANNHCLDYGFEAFQHTLQLLEENGIAWAGAGTERFSARKPAILEKKGCRVAFLAYASFFDLGTQATETHPGLAPIRVDPLYAPPHINEEDLREMTDNIKDAKAQADIVMVSHHWGVSGGRTLTLYQRHLAHQTIDSGADIVLGGHPHILQGIELYKGKVICYSFGNFIFGIWGSFWYDAAKETMLLTCLIKDKEIKGVFFRPVVANASSQPELAPPDGQIFKRIADTMCALSAPLGTSLYPQKDKIWVKGL
jgi:poly-gamma-glutamate capsule biosynthesis protein CapA/YwtB (metallophosphatase superfamily)